MGASDASELQPRVSNDERELQPPIAFDSIDEPSMIMPATEHTDSR